MPSNAWTQQTPLADSSIKTVLAERVFIKDYSDALTYADPTALLDGVSTTLISDGWADLGIVMGSKVQLTYTKETKYIETGIEKVRRGAYITSKTAQAQFTLEQFDMKVLELITGQTADVVGSPAIGKKIHIGQDDLVNKALLFVGTNKVDGKEFHTFCKKGALTFNIQENDDARVMQVNAELFSFLPATETVEAYFTMFVLEPA